MEWVGGHTVDVAAIDPGGNIDLQSLHSTRTGVIDLVQGFEAEIRTNFSGYFQDVGDLDIKRVEKSIVSGEYRVGRVPLDVRQESENALNKLVNDIIQVINSAGGVANFDVVLVTGGGAALIYDRLVEAIPLIEFILAEPNRDHMIYANVYGGAKLSALIRRDREYA